MTILVHNPTYSLVYGFKHRDFDAKDDNMGPDEAFLNKHQLERSAGKSKPLYQQIFFLVQDSIRSGHLKPGQQLPSRAEMVRFFEVEYRTVNAALEMLEKEGLIQLNDKGDFLISAPLHPILKMSLVYFYWVKSLFNISISEGCRRFADEVEMEYVALDVSRSLEHLARIITSKKYGINGFVVIPWDFPAFRDVMQQALDDGIKIVFVDHDLPGMEISSVAADHYTGGYKATTHLLDNHQGPVYYVGSTSAPASCKGRYDGWRAAMTDHGFTHLNRYVYEISRSDQELSGTMPESPQMIHQHKETAIRLFNSEASRPYCIFTSADNVARGVYEAAAEMNLSVGQDIFITGYGDKPFAAKLPVPLTSVFTDDEKIGYEAMRMLYNQLMGAGSNTIHRVMPVSLQIRASSLFPAARKK